MGVISINYLYYPVVTLGPKIRIGLWLQGCSIRCNGCMSLHTWDFDKGEKIEIKQLAERINSINCKNITISGGEPFDQSQELLELLKLIRPYKTDILLYTGYTKRKINTKFKEHLKYIDVIVCNPFIKGQESKYLYKGSENQEMIILNKNLEDLYTKYKTRLKSKTLQITDDVIIGIPYQKDYLGVIDEL